MESEFGGIHDYLNPIVMATYRIPVKPISTRDWQGQTQTLSNVSIYFPSDARFDYEKPDENNPGLFLRIRGKEWFIDGDPETWKFGGLPHIKVNAKRESTGP
ncbi:hypothetical protein [Nonomuraea gerenzanensis]|uniref:Uncharacterized protein n=1 Tax=Nonomuraea gerenzanensis TaxID=93944 RepID=A0A1M4DVG2_9ACTN|nr:hypothetical protein [Nonomuraea gerenzanensis]UBU12912.1 hypothetical protein LCN96_53175 [Nonomuraea gerenzanensis]SBO90564.1 hypothetical protein BN4615_P78 [Nonomuraea gerenzanensis]